VFAPQTTLQFAKRIASFSKTWVDVDAIQ